MARSLSVYSFVAGLLCTTTVSTLLIVASARNWRITGGAYLTITGHRASIQLSLQLLAGLLGLIHSTIVCRLINQAARIRLLRRPVVRLGTLKAWANLSIPRAQLDVPARYLAPVLAVACLSLVSSALWTGALTPIPSSQLTQATVQVPSYGNTSLIREYPSEVDQTGPSISNTMGIFTYSVGLLLLGNLMTSAASATTADRSVRIHPKIDNTHFVYHGRSYGVGASVGLVDGTITSMGLATGYNYTETGYVANVSCVFNASTQFTIQPEEDTFLYPAAGPLPDSTSSGEFSVYIGHGDSAIVAIGVSADADSPRRYLAIAAGSSYAALNATQCTVDFVPTTFAVSVELGPRNISVTPLGAADDLDPQRNLTRTLMRQYELIANDLTEFYRSTLGDALLSSVSSWNASYNANHTVPEPRATLAGVENALTAMADDMLVAYAGAQMMVANLTGTVPADVQVSAMAVGQPAYIIAVASLNFVVLVLFIVEIFRTGGWRAMHPYDFADPLWILAASYRALKSGQTETSYGLLSGRANDDDDAGAVVIMPSSEASRVDLDTAIDLTEYRGAAMGSHIH